MSKLLMPREVDRLLRYPRGRSARLAREGKIACVRLPDGEIRFAEDAIQSMLASSATFPAGGSRKAVVSAN